MTTLQTPTTRDLTADARTWIATAGAAVVAGVLLGVGDLELLTHLSYPYANLANSSSVWALAAFLFGAVVARTPAQRPHAVVGGVILLLVAVESYYLAAVALLGDGTAMLTSPTTRMWLTFAVIAGVAFGAAGAWWRTGSLGTGALGLAAGASVLLAESAMEILRGATMDPGDHLFLLPTALLTAALGVGVLLLGAARPARALLAAVLCVPVTIAFLVAFTGVGFGL